MGSRQDKNSKLPSGKAKESSSAGKSKGKSVPDDPKPATARASAAKSAKAAKPATAAEIRKSKPAAAKESTEKKPVAKAAKTTRAASTSTASRAAKAPAATATASKSGAARPAAKATRAKGESASDAPGLEEFSIALIKPGETKERIWRTKSFHQMQVQREFGFPDVAPELPGHYQQDKLVLMPKDPEYMFCYWELTQGLLDEKSKEKMTEGNYRETLKINWESRSLFEPNFTFIPVFFWARKWYFGVPQVGQRYQVELGWLSDTGHFISIIRSNLSELPESWAQTQKRLSEQGEVLAYTARSTKPLGSSEHLAVEDTRAFVPEWNLSSESFSSSSWSRAAGANDGAAATASKPAVAPGATSAAQAAKPAAAKEAASKKPAVPKARLEVSGKVLPGTQVAVAGKQVPTDGQGFFKTDFPYEQDTLRLELTDRSGASRSFAYDLKELVLT